MPNTVLIQSVFKVNRCAKTKRPEAQPRALRETIIDYGTMCGDAVSELNEQLTSGVAPTVAVV